MRSLCIHFQLDLVVRSGRLRLIDSRADRFTSLGPGTRGSVGVAWPSPGLTSDFHLLKQLLGSRRNLSSQDRAQSVIRLLPN